jgi:hypothetical protein
MWHDFGVRQLLCITRRPHPFYVYHHPILFHSIPIPVGNGNPPNWILGLCIVYGHTPFRYNVPWVVPSILYIARNIVLSTLYSVLQWDLQKGDVHGSMSGPDLPLHQPPAIAVGSVIIISVPFHAVSNTAYNMNDNVRTRYVDMLIFCVYVKPTL